MLKSITEMLSKIEINKRPCQDEKNERPSKKAKIDLPHIEPYAHNDSNCGNITSTKAIATKYIRYCPFCYDQEFTNKEDLRGHLNQHRKNDDGLPPFCMFCREAFKGSGLGPKNPQYCPKMRSNLHRKHRVWHIRNGHVLKEDIEILEPFLKKDHLASMKDCIANFLNKQSKIQALKEIVISNKVQAQNECKPKLEQPQKITEQNLSEKEYTSLNNNSNIFQPTDSNILCHHCKLSFPSRSKFQQHLEIHLDATFSLQGHIDHFIIPISGYFCKLCEVFYAPHDNITPKDHFKSNVHKINLEHLAMVFDEGF